MPASSSSLAAAANAASNFARSASGSSACSSTFDDDAPFQLHRFDEFGIQIGGFHGGEGTLGRNQRGDLLLDPGDGLFARQCDLGHRILGRIFGLGLGGLHDGLGFGLGIGDDLGGFALRFRDQTFGLGATLLQPLVVELLGQLLKFVLHSVLIIVIQ